MTIYFHLSKLERRERVIKEHKGPLDKAKGGRIEGGRWGWVGQGKVVVG